MNEAGKAFFPGTVHEAAGRGSVEEALRESEERFRQLAENIREVFWLQEVGPSRMLYISPAYEAVWGRTRQSLYDCPRSWAESIHPEDRERVMARANNQLRGDFEVQFRILRPDGSVRWVEAREFPIPDVNGTVYRVAGIAQDITARKTAEDFMNRAKHEAEEANAAKSEFLSRMSHELRTPLNAILGFGQLLELSELQPDDRESVSLILTAGRHLLELINEVLDIARIESGRLPMSVEPVCVAEAIGQAVDVLRPLSVKQRITVEVDMRGRPGQYVRADRQRLMQILINLLSNAVKYNRPEGSVVIFCEPRDQKCVRIGVADTGPGIAAEDTAKLFVPFERLQADRTRVEGTGLGLAVCRRLADAMDGTMGVKSVVGAGSTFWVGLPASEAPLEEGCTRNDRALVMEYAS